MESSKFLVVYFSRSGHTKALAETIAREAGADIEELVPSAPYTFGFLGYVRALYHSISHRNPEIQALSKDPSEYELVIVGGPVWGGETAAPVRSFLEKHKGDLRAVAFFATQGGPAGRPRLFHHMQEACGRDPVATLAVTDREMTDGTMARKVDGFLKLLGGSGGRVKAAV